jgi:hypothetical protein
MDDHNGKNGEDYKNDHHYLRMVRKKDNQAKNLSFVP